MSASLFTSCSRRAGALARACAPALPPPLPEGGALWPAGQGNAGNFDASKVEKVLLGRKMKGLEEMMVGTVTSCLKFGHLKV